MMNKIFQVSSFVLFSIISIAYALKRHFQYSMRFLLLLQKQRDRMLPILTCLQKPTLI